MAVLNRKHAFSMVIAATLTFALFIGGLPPLSGVTIASAGPPAFTLDICHPVPGINHGMGLSAVPLNDTMRSIEKPLARGTPLESTTPLVIRASEAPDPPPPKSLR